MFSKATKKKAKLRLALEGPSGSGKTTAALNIASGLGGKIAFIDTEHGSASLYSDMFDFDVLDLAPPYAPERFIEALKAAEQAGYETVVIDSMTHEWEGEGGCLDILNSLGGRFTDWSKVTPRHNAFINAILQSNCHVIGTWRTKTEYAVEVNNRGKSQPTKIGTAPKQRDGLEYEFTSVFSINQQHYAEASKDRTRLFDGAGFYIDKSTGEKLLSFLNEGEDALANQIKACMEKIRAASDINTLRNEFGHAWTFAGKNNMEAEKLELKKLYDSRVTDLEKASTHEELEDV